MSHTSIATRPQGIRLPEALWERVEELARYTAGTPTSVIEAILSRHIDEALETARRQQPSLFGGDE